jgi:dephospho-CoA kinase
MPGYGARVVEKVVKGKLILGLIGGIGSGKSLVAAELAKRRGHVITGDQLGHEAILQPDIKEKVIKRWGREIVDEQGNIKRRQLGSIVFAEPSQLKELEALLFPFIERRIDEEIKKAETDPAALLIVLDAAVMREAGWDRRCDKIVFVDAPREVRYQRLAQQRGLRAEEVEARERAQLPLPEKKRRADFVLDNSGPPTATARQVDELLKKWGIP